MMDVDAMDFFTLAGKYREPSGWIGAGILPVARNMDGTWIEWPNEASIIATRSVDGVVEIIDEDMSFVFVPAPGELERVKMPVMGG